MAHLVLAAKSLIPQSIASMIQGAKQRPSDACLATSEPLQAAVNLVQDTPAKGGLGA